MDPSNLLLLARITLILSLFVNLGNDPINLLLDRSRCSSEGTLDRAGKVLRILLPETSSFFRKGNSISGIFPCNPFSGSEMAVTHPELLTVIPCHLLNG